MTSKLTFNCAKISQYYGTPISVSRPKELTCFSYDDNHVFFTDDRSLRYFYPPRLGVDLCRGFENFHSLREDIDEHLDALLKALIEFEASQNAACKANVITWRGMLTKIMISPFDNSGFEMNAVKFQDSIFIEENHDYKLASRTSQLRQSTPSGFPSQEMMSYWGYKFETISTIPRSWDETSREFIESREHQRVQNLRQYCSVIDTKIGETSLILGGEVDAVWDHRPDQGEPIAWVELKTTALIENERDSAKYERKLLKFWAQSFLLGVPKIIVGVRSKIGSLVGIEEIETQKIPAFVKNKGNAQWDASVCLNFTADFLKWLRLNIEGPHVWRIQRRNRSPVIELFLLEGTTAETVLSHDFVEWRRRYSQSSCN